MSDLKPPCLAGIGVRKAFLMNLEEVSLEEQIRERRVQQFPYASDQ